MWDNGETFQQHALSCHSAAPECGLRISRFTGALGPKAIREHGRELDQAFDFISKSHTMSHEALNRILDRSPLPYARNPKVPAKRGQGQAWKTTQGPNFQAKHGLFQIMMYNTAKIRY